MKHRHSFNGKLLPTHFLPFSNSSHFSSHLSTNQVLWLTKSVFFTVQHRKQSECIMLVSLIYSIRYCFFMHIYLLINYSLKDCNTYNADYDGDEMNCHFPQNDIARAESEFIARTDLQYIVPTDGSPLRGLIQDHVDAGVKMTSKDTFFEKWEYQQLMFACLSSLSGLELVQSDANIEMLPPAIVKPRELWTGKQVISTLLHHLRKGRDGDPTSREILPGISVERKAKTPNVAFGDHLSEHLVIVRDGELLRGILDKAAFGSTDHSLVHGVYEAYGPTKAGLLLNAFGRLFTAYLQYYSGHSCRMEDLILKSDINHDRRKLVQVSQLQKKSLWSANIMSIS